MADIQISSEVKQGDAVEIIYKDGQLIAVPKRKVKILTGPKWQDKQSKDIK